MFLVKFEKQIHNSNHLFKIDYIVEDTFEDYIEILLYWKFVMEIMFLTNNDFLVCINFFFCHIYNLQ
jgi:hypothetical protein